MIINIKNFLLLACLSVTTFTLASELKFDKAEISQIVAPEIENLEFEFSFKTSGKDNVSIISVSPDCSCLKDLKADKSEYKAGDKGKITGLFATAGMAGAQNKKIFVKTSSSEVPQILNLKFEVQEYLKISPKVVFASAAEDKASIIRINSFYDADISNFKIETGYANVKLELKEGTSKNKFELHIKALPETKPGRATINIAYTTPDAKTKSYTVYAMIR